MRTGLINFAIERQRHDGFVGRAALLDRLDQLLIADHTDRWVVVTGGPGMGKSALLAAWLARREAAGATVPHHFIRRSWDDWDDPEKLVGSLVAQIEARFPDQRESEADARMSPAARLAAKLGRVSERELVPRGKRLVVLTDGLDEYDPPPGPPARDPLAAFLPYALPRGVSFVCASRPRHPYVDMLATRGVLVQLDLDDERSFAADNAATVRAFWDRAAPELGLGARFIAEAVARAGGNLQHAAMLRLHLAGLPPEQRRVEDIPRGLAALLASTWERIATDPAVVDGLGILCAAREALTLDELGAVAGWTGEAQRRAFVRGARELLIETRRANAVPEYRLHHESIRAHVAGAIGTVALRGHHRALAQKLAIWPPPGDQAVRRYALRHALLHRAEAGEWGDAWRVAADMSFLEAKCRELGAQEAEADVARTAEHCRVEGDEALCRRFDDLARALGRESRWLQTAPEATAGLVWNQLRRSGWSIDDLDQQLCVSSGASFLHLRHVATRESHAFERDLVGHAARVTACAVTPDGRRVISASDDHTLKVWDLASGQPVTTLQGHAAKVTACTVTPDGRRVVSASDDHTLKVWDLASGQPVATMQGYVFRVTACAVIPDGRRVVSASDDGTLKSSDLASGQPVAAMQGHAFRVTSCAVIPDGQRVVSASDDGTLKVRDLSSGELVAVLQDHHFFVTACAVTQDGRHVVSAAADGTLNVWDLASGRPIATLQGHAYYVTACAVTSDGQRVVSASADGTLKVWDLESYTCLVTHRGNAVYSAVAATATTIFAGDATGSVWFFDWPSSNRRERSARGSHGHDNHRSSSPGTELSSPRPPMKHTILFLAANPLGTDRLALDEECAAIERELRMTSGRNDFDFRSEWAVSVDGLMRLLNELQPTIVHFSGHGRTGAAGSPPAHGGPHRDIEPPRGAGILLHDEHGSQYVSERALAKVIASAAPSTRVVVLNAGFTAAIAESLRHVVDCVVGMDGAIGDAAARLFAVAFYRALGNRRSVGNAVAQAVATLAAKQLPDDLPVCRTRDGLSADQIFLPTSAPHRPDPAEPRASRPGAGTAAGSQPGRPAATTDAPKVDIGILTIRDDEFRAVLAAFPDKAGTYKGASREYSLRHADAGTSERYRIAVLRLIEQGNGEAQDAARDLIDDLAPRLVLVVGIAGGLPSDDVKLGDVVVSTRIQDFTVEARKAGQAPAYAVTGGPVDKALAAVVANLAAREDELGNWTADLSPPPPVTWTREGQLYGPPEWQRELRDKLEHHHGTASTPRAPIYAAGPIASSDRLVKDPELLIPWLQAARNLLAIEMESGGVYRAARERCPMLAIRGISDIVGLKRADAWTKYACASAAAFTRAFLRTRPVEVGSSAGVAADPS